MRGRHPFFFSHSDPQQSLFGQFTSAVLPGQDGTQSPRFTLLHQAGPGCVASGPYQHDSLQVYYRHSWVSCGEDCPVLSTPPFCRHPSSRSDNNVTPSFWAADSHPMESNGFVRRVQGLACPFLPPAARFPLPITHESHTAAMI